jgi:hypothetical protein
MNSHDLNLTTRLLKSANVLLYDYRSDPNKQDYFFMCYVSDLENPMFEMTFDNQAIKTCLISWEYPESWIATKALLEIERRK